MSGAANSNISVKIGFDDQALDRIPAANKRIQSLETSSGRAARGIQTMVQGGGTEKLAKGMRGLARESLQAFENIGRIMGPLEVITGAASVAGLARLTAGWGDLTTQLGYSAQRAGVGVGQLSALQGAARLVGISTQSVTAGMTALNDNLTAAATGHAPEAIAAFNYLHIALRDANGQLRSSTSVLPEIADKLAGIKNPAIQAQLATILLGGAAADLLPFLRQGSAGIAQLTQEAKSYGTTSAADVKISNRFTHQQGELMDAIGGLSNVMGEKYLPALGNAEQGLANFIKTNKETIADAIPAMILAFGGLGLYLKGPFLKVIRKALLGDLAQTIEQAATQAKTEVAAAAEDAASAANAPSSGIPRRSSSGLNKGLFVGSLPMYFDLLGQWLDPNSRPTFRDTQSLHDQFPGLNWAPGTNPNPPSGTAAGLPKNPIVTPPGPASAPRGIRNDNPLNLTYVPGQPGVEGSDGTFGVYKSMAAGIGADLHQLILNQRKGDTTLAQQITAWAPPGTNDTSGYIARVAKMTGIDPGAPLDVTNPKTAAAVVGAMAVVENGQGLSAKDISAGVQLALGQSAASQASPSAGIPAVPASPPGPHGHGASTAVGIPEAPDQGPSLSLPASHAPSGPAQTVAGGAGTGAAASETTVKGSATVSVNIKGAPPGTQTSATSDGDLFANAGPVKIQSSAVGQGMQA